MGQYCYMKWLPLVLLAILMGCASNETLMSRDGQQIAYKYYEGGWSGVILVHQLDGSKEDWKSLENSLEKEGISYISIDLRGHGKSQGDWTSFSEKDFNDMIYDVEAAHKFLRKNGVNLKTIIGASVGANIVFKYALWKDVPSLILLSPGFDYRGIDISKDIGNYTHKILVFAGTSDSYSYKTAKVFERDNRASFAGVSGPKHGTDMLPSINPKIILFIKG